VTGRSFDDFQVGDTFETAGLTLTESAIIDFALTYDPQPFHIDREHAARSMYGGLIASGFQTMALSFRLFRDTGVLNACNIGGSGAEAVKWLMPVRPGDTLRVRVEILALEPSRTRPDRGRARIGYTTLNQNGEPVMTMVLNHILARRGA
jgi:acyl dehydratase